MAVYKIYLFFIRFNFYRCAAALSLSGTINVSIHFTAQKNNQNSSLSNELKTYKSMVVYGKYKTTDFNCTIYSFFHYDWIWTWNELRTVWLICCIEQQQNGMGRQKKRNAANGSNALIYLHLIQHYYNSQIDAHIQHIQYKDDDDGYVDNDIHDSYEFTALSM